MERETDSAGAWGASQGAIPSRRAARWLPLLALPYALLVAWLLARQADLPGLLHDDGVYVAMARGIEQGLGPIDTHLGADARTARFPPLYPLVLAATRRLLGVAPDGVAGSSRWVALNGLFLGVAGATFLHWLLAWRRVAPLVALAVTAAAFTAPTLLGLSQHLMSEPLFLALLVVALWLHERALGNGAPAPGRARTVAAALVIGLLPATRTLGAAALLALALHRGLALRSAGAGLRYLALAAAPWLAAAAWSATAAAGAAASPLFGPPYRQLLVDHLGELPWIVTVNAVRFADWTAYAIAPGWPLADGSSALAALARLVPGVLLAAGAAVVCWRCIRAGAPPPAAPLLALCTVALLLPWPFPDLRFMVPLAPFALLSTARLLDRLVPRRLGGAVVPLLALTVWNGPLARDVVRAADREAGQAAFFGRSIPVAPFRAAADELRRQAALAAPRTPADAPAFASTLDSLFSLASGVRGASAWVNDQPFEEAYVVEPGAWRKLWYSPVPPLAAQSRMAARADAVEAEYRRLGVRWLLLPRLAGAGMVSHQVLLEQLLQRDRNRPAADRRFSPAWRSRGGEFWLFELAP